jgi:uncharacterized protein
MRAVLDTTVLISTFLTEGGAAAELLDRARDGGFMPVLAPEIMAELRRVLLTRRRIRRRYPYTDEDVREYLRVLGAIATVVTDLPPLTGVVRDPDDDMIVATAVRGRADRIVTRDRDLLALGAYGNVRVVTPRQFLDELAQGGG